MQKLSPASGIAPSPCSLMGGPHLQQDPGKTASQGSFLRMSITHASIVGGQVGP